MSSCWKYGFLNINKTSGFPSATRSDIVGLAYTVLSLAVVNVRPSVAAGPNVKNIDQCWTNVNADPFLP